MVPEDLVLCYVLLHYQEKKFYFILFFVEAHLLLNFFCNGTPYGGNSCNF